MIKYYKDKRVTNMKVKLIECCEEQTEELEW